MSKQGMDYEDVRKRVRRLEKDAKNRNLKDNLVNSLINQARRRDGVEAAKEIRREIDKDFGKKWK